jgi:uncharacterized protein (DUF433 family)
VSLWPRVAMAMRRDVCYDVAMSYLLPDPLVTTTRERRGGQAVFAGTRVPVQTLFDYLVEENGFADFLTEFPEISREHIAAVLRLAREKAFPEPLADPQKAA